MALYDFSNTKAILIGVGEFPEEENIHPIPNIKANIELFHKTLIDKNLIGIPEENIILSINEDRKTIEKKLVDIAKETRSKLFTLLVYYTGHGMYSTVDGEFYFTTRDSTIDYLDTNSININLFRSRIDRSLAGRKIIILDCCHSGEFIGSMGSLESQIQSDLNKFQGSYVMTSSSKDKRSQFPVDQPDQPTFFTGKLIDVLQKGVEGPNEYFSLQEIYDEIDNYFSTTDIPRPQQSNMNSAGDILLAKNIRYKPPVISEEGDWEKAVLKNNKIDYINFIQNFPASSHVIEAKARIGKLTDDEAWENALKINDLNSFIDYLVSHGAAGAHVNEAKLKIEKIKEEFANPKSEMNQVAEKEQAKEKIKEPVNEEIKEPAGVLDVDLYDRGNTILAMTNAAEQTAALKEFMIAFPDNKIPLLYDCKLDEQRKNHRASKLKFEKLIEKYPDFTEGLYHYSLLIGLVFEEYKKAADILEKIKKLEPDRENINNDLAAIYHFYLKDFNKAKKCYQQVIIKTPDDHVVLNYYGLLLMEKLNQPAQAKPNFEKAIQLDPDNATYLFNLGLLYFYHLNNLNEGAKYYKKAIAIDPNLKDNDIEELLRQNKQVQTLQRNTPVNNSNDIIASFSDVTKRKFENKNVITYAISDSNGELLIKQKSIEFKNILTHKKYNHIVNIEYLDAEHDQNAIYNYIAVTYREQPHGPNQKILFFKANLFESKPTLKIFNTINNLITNGVFQLLK